MVMITHMPPKKKNSPQRMEHSMDRYVCIHRSDRSIQGYITPYHKLSNKRAFAQPIAGLSTLCQDQQYCGKIQNTAKCLTGADWPYNWLKTSGCPFNAG